MNSIFVIAPYKHLDIWVFDDEKRGLIQEPFVGSADDIIDRWTAHIPDADNGFVVVFSSEAFPGATLQLIWQRKELSGNIYRCEELDMEGWLCPALLRYFEEPPTEIFAKCEARK